MKISLYIYLILITGLSFGQTSSGKVLDNVTKKPIPFASLQILDLGIGTTTDSSGTFVFSGKLPNTFLVQFSCIGYNSMVVNLALGEGIEILVEESHLQLEEVTISSSTGKLENQTIVNVETRKLSELNIIQSQSLGEAITNIPGVYQSTTGGGISKPVIRGLSGSRIVTYLNGLRIENQQWGGDHGMGVQAVGIGNVEVIKGPNSLLFGADALGGVIYFVDEPYADQQKTEGYFQTQFNGNTLGSSNTLALKTSKKNIRVNVFGNFSSFADYKLANGKYVKNSRYNNKNVKLSVGFNGKRRVSNIRYNFLSSTLGLPGHTHETTITPDVFQSDNQNRKSVIPKQVINNHYLLFENKFYLSKGEVFANLGYTSNRLTEFDEKVTIAGIDMTLFNGTYNFYYKSPVKDLLNYSVGLQGMRQQNLNHAGASEKLIPNSISIDNGAYVLVNISLEQTNIEAGIRYDNRLVATQEGFKGNGIINKSFGGLNYSFGFSRNTKKSTVRLSVSSGYRAPNTIELLANGLHHGTLTYDIGDVNLKSENAIQVDASYELHREHFELIINPFYNVVNGFIYRKPTEDYIDGFQVYEFTQLARASITGGSVGLHYHPHYIDNLHLESSYSHLYAFDNDNNPLPRIPQNRINSFLKYEMKQKSKVNLKNIVLQHRYFFNQARVGENESITKNYQLINLGINLKVNVKHPVEIGLGVKNILNVAYIDHLSRLKDLGLENQGRNIYGTLKINI
jgi:iron complex outermembrane receptor protein